MAGINWLGLLQPEDASLPAQPGGCARCHPGLGAKPNPIDQLTDADLANVDCLHLNDSRHEAGSRRDRHANIGQGHIGQAQAVGIAAQRPLGALEDPAEGGERGGAR